MLLNSLSVHTPYLLVLIMAVCTGYTFWRLARFAAPVLAPVGRFAYGNFYHSRYSAHRKTRSYSRRELVDLDQSNFSVPETHVEELPAERTWSEITAQYEREMVAAYERTDSGQLRPLPFDTSEMPAIQADYPKSNVRVFWGTAETQPDMPRYSEPAPYPTDPYEDQFAYDASRWQPTRILEPVG